MSKRAPCCSAAHVISFAWAGLSVHLPGWLTPGALTVSHAELGEGRFSFGLDVVHPQFGGIIHQEAVFQEITP